MFETSVQISINCGFQIMRLTVLAIALLFSQLSTAAEEPRICAGIRTVFVVEGHPVFPNQTADGITILDCRLGVVRQ